MQRYGAATRSGDINTTFATLEAQVLLGLNTSMSGVPYWGTDIGGFFPAGLTPELYARWFAFGAFCPLFRSHGWVWRRHVPWAHGPEVEAVCRHFAEVRMRLLPYLYTLAWRAHRHGEPLMRPLVYHYPDDPTAPAAPRTADQPRDRLTLLVYPPPPGAAAETALYDDDGDSPAYGRGEHALTPIRCTAGRAEVRIEAGGASPGYPGQPAQRRLSCRVWLERAPA